MLFTLVILKLNIERETLLVQVLKQNRERERLPLTTV
jgi:hypothetical protein